MGFRNETYDGKLEEIPHFSLKTNIPNSRQPQDRFYPNGIYHLLAVSRSPKEFL
jgi:hypothetical protein